MKKLLLLILMLAAIPLQAQTDIQGNITSASTTCAAPTACVTLLLSNSAGAAIQLSGTFTGTVPFEATADGTNWAAINGTPPSSTTAVTSATAAGIWQFGTAGMRGIRARGSALSAGGVSVSIVATSSSSSRGGAGSGSAGGLTANCGTALDTYVAYFTDAFTVCGDAGLTYVPATDVLTSTIQSIVAGALASTVNALSVTGTLSATAAIQRGVKFSITSANGASQAIGQFVELLPGAATGVVTAASLFENTAAGTGTSLVGSSANYGTYGYADSTTAGSNIGVFGYGSGGGISVGVAGRAINAKNAATNIGVLGFGLNTGSTPIQIGGFFGLMGSAPTFTSAALMADNGTTTDPIFVGRNNGTDVLVLADDNVLTTSGALVIGTAESFKFGSRGGIRATADGTMRIFNNVDGAVANLVLGTPDANFPMLKRSLTSVNFVKADDSVLTGIAVASVAYSSGTSANAMIQSGTPAIAGNGTLNTGSQNSSGKVTTNNTGASTATLTFSTAFTLAPACNVTNETTANLSRATSTTTTVVLAGTTVSGDVWAYSCLGY